MTLLLLKMIHTEFEIKDLGELRFFLGIEFARSKKGIVIYFNRNTLDLLEQMRMLGAKPVHSIEQNNSIDDKCEELLCDIKLCHRLVR